MYVTRAACELVPLERHSPIKDAQQWQQNDQLQLQLRAHAGETIITVGEAICVEREVIWTTICTHMADCCVVVPWVAQTT